jgi:hypothetical protein
MERSVSPIPLHRMRRVRVEGQPERSLEPLDPGPPAERARPMSGMDSLRLAAWRQAHTRWPYALLLGLGVLLGALMPGELGHYADVGVLWLVPILALVLGAGDHARREAFWRGLGGPPGARAAGRVLSHLVLLGTPLLLSGTHLLMTHADRLGIALAAATLLLYATASAMRLVVDSVLGRVAATVGVLGLLLATTGLSAGIRVWSLVDAFEVRAWGVVLVGLAATLLLEGRLGSLGAGLRRSGRWPLVAGLGLVLLGPAVVEAAWMRPADGSLVVESFHGDTALLKPRERGAAADWLFSGGRLWLWREGALTRLPVSDVIEAKLGGQGEVYFWQLQDPLVPLWSETRVGVLMPDGELLDCGAPGSSASPDCARAEDMLHQWPLREQELPDGTLRSYEQFSITDLRADGSAHVWDTPYLVEDPF